MSSTYRGMAEATGRAVDGLDHLQQSVRDILTTPIGSRVMRRDYGSRLPELVDEPLNQTTLLALYAATAEALSQWEPRLELTRVGATVSDAGQVVLELQGRYLPNGQDVEIGGIAL